MAQGAEILRRKALNNLSGDGGQTILASSVYYTAHLMEMIHIDREDVLGEEALYQSSIKCWKGVGKKYSAQIFKLNGIKNCYVLASKIRSGTYKQSKPRKVAITYPKPRTALSITFTDRVPQRSLNDIAIYPQMTKSFIYANAACQIGKGTEMALNEMKKMLHRAFLKYGTNKFAVFIGDVRKYYDNMRHDVVNAQFARNLEPWVAETASSILDVQYKGDVGYNPGSQMVQIAGISYLNPFDHFAKEQLRIKMYLRYMDDVRICGKDADEVMRWRDALSIKLQEVGLEWHKDKTRVIRGDDGFLFLGFVFRVTETGKVLMFRDPSRIKENRQKLRRLANKVVKLVVGIEDFDESYADMRACFTKGNSKRLVRNMDTLYQALRREILYARGETSAVNGDAPREGDD